MPSKDTSSPVRFLARIWEETMPRCWELIVLKFADCSMIMDSALLDLTADSASP